VTTTQAVRRAKILAFVLIIAVSTTAIIFGARNGGGPNMPPLEIPSIEETTPSKKGKVFRERKIIREVITLSMDARKRTRYLRLDQEGRLEADILVKIPTHESTVVWEVFDSRGMKVPSLRITSFTKVPVGGDFLYSFSGAEGFPLGGSMVVSIRYGP